MDDVFSAACLAALRSASAFSSASRSSLLRRIKDLGLNLRPFGRGSEPFGVFELDAGFGEFRGKADFNRCTERRGGGEPATTLGVDAETSGAVVVSGCVSGAWVCSLLPDVPCTSLTSLTTASLGEGALRASLDSCSRVVFRADCLGRCLTLGGILYVENYQYLLSVMTERCAS